MGEEQNKRQSQASQSQSQASQVLPHSTKFETIPLFL